MILPDCSNVLVKVVVILGVMQLYPNTTFSVTPQLRIS